MGWGAELNTANENEIQKKKREIKAPRPQRLCRLLRPRGPERNGHTRLRVCLGLAAVAE